MIRDAAIAFLMRIVGIVFWIAYTIMIARTLSQAQFGLVQYWIAFVLLSGSVASIGFESTIVKFASTYWEKNDLQAFAAVVRQGRLRAAVTSALCLIVLIIASYLKIKTPLTTDWSITLFASIAFFSSALMGLHRDALRASGNLLLALFGQSIIRAAVPLLMSAIFWLANLLDAITAIGMFTVGLLVSNIFEIWGLRRLHLPIPEINLARARERSAYGWQVWIGDIFYILLLRSPGLIVGILFGLESAALYLAAERISSLSLFLTEAVHTAIGRPAAVAWGGQNSRRDLANVVRSASAMTAMSGFFSSAVLIAIGWPVLALLGFNYTAAYPILLIQLAGWLATAVFGPLYTINAVCGLLRYRNLACIVGFATCCLIILWAWRSGDLNYAAIGYAVGIWVLHLIMFVSLKREIGIVSGVFGTSATVYISIMRESLRKIRRIESRLTNRN